MLSGAISKPITTEDIMSLEDHLKARKKRNRKNRLLRLIGAWGLLCCAIVFLFVYYNISKGGHREKVTPKTEKTLPKKTFIRSALYDGNYELILKEFDENRIEAKEFSPSLFDTLSVEFKLTYLPDNNTPLQSDIKKISLNSSEPYHLIVDVSEKCYLYVLQQTSSNTMVQLFPNKEYSSLDNPLDARELRIPEGTQWIYLDKFAGKETIYLIATRWRQKKLENLLQALNSMPSDSGSLRPIQQGLLEYLDNQHFGSRYFPNIAFSKYEFAHEKGDDHEDIY